jgi:two-component system CheB/CheR fusion protein
MKNLLNGTNIGTVFLDNELNIKRFTEQAKSVISLIPSDVGRPISDLVSKLNYDGLIEDAREVLRTLSFKEIEVRSTDDTWFLMRILPYRTAENLIDGLVMTFVDITKIKGLERTEREAHKSEHELQRALSESRTTIFRSDKDLRYCWVSGEGFLGHPSESIEGKTDIEIFPEPMAAALRGAKQAVFDTGAQRTSRITETFDGKTVDLVLFVAPELDRTEKVSGVLCVATLIPKP